MHTWVVLHLFKIAIYIILDKGRRSEAAYIILVQSFTNEIKYGQKFDSKNDSKWPQ